MIGKTLAHYEILESLGAGGMGDVYLALDTRLNRKVALKTLRQDEAAPAGRLARLRREAQATASLNHPGVVTVHSVEEVDGILFITMEHVVGRTLDRFIGPQGMEADTFRDLAGQIAGAVAAAHEAGIVHRDLKPGNVMVDARDRVKVLDFGLALMGEPDGGPVDQTRTVQQRTQPGTILGTAPYMSPEQVRGQEVDVRSDVFSLGSVFYQMATGKRPFTGSSVAELTSAVLRDRPAGVNLLRPGFPDELERIIFRCLEKEPASRYVHAGHLAEALLRETKEPSVSASPDTGSIPILGVVDFQNITRDSAADWLSTGIAETVTVDLNKISGVRTLPREQLISAWSQLERGDEKASIETARNLGLDYLVTGAFQKMGDRIRITGQILDVDRGTMAGSVKLDGVMDDIFDLQDRILAGLLAEAEVSLSTSPVHAPRPRETEALLAYEKYSQAKAKILYMGVKAFSDAEDLLNEALAIDPDYALAHTAFGQMRAMRYIATTDVRDLEEAMEHLEKAIALDPHLDEPYVWLTYCLGRLDRFEDAIATGKKAIGLNPARSQAHYFTGVAHWMRGASNFQPGDWEAAIIHLAEAGRLQPTYQPSFMARFDVLFRLGRLEEARADAEHAANVEASGNWDVAVFLGAETQLGLLDLREGKPDLAQRRFEVSDERLAGSAYVYAPIFRVMNFYGQARVAEARGNLDMALDRLRRGRDLAEQHPRTLGMGRVLVRIGAALGETLARAGKTREAEEELSRTVQFWQSRARFDFSAVWMNMDADLYMEMARAREALGQEDLAVEMREKAVVCGWPSLSE